MRNLSLPASLSAQESKSIPFIRMSFGSLFFSVGKDLSFSIKASNQSNGYLFSYMVFILRIRRPAAFPLRGSHGNRHHELTGYGNSLQKAALRTGRLSRCSGAFL